MNKIELIQFMIDENRLETRKQKDPDSCPCYNGTRCHNSLSDFEMICLLCVCPEYDRSIPEGGCKINSPFGKKFDRKKWGLEPIWDCSDCTIPHRETYVKSYLEQLSVTELQEIRKCKTYKDLWKFYDKV